MGSKKIFAAWLQRGAFVADDKSMKEKTCAAARQR
jgi:hypothetical protein